MADDTDSDAETETYHRYRVDEHQPGRANKPVRHAGGAWTPGTEFVGPAALAEPLNDRVSVVAEDVDADAAGDDFGVGATQAADGASGDESDSDDDAGANGRDERGPPEHAADAAHENAGDADDESDADADDESDESDADEPVNRDELVARLDYDELSVPDLRSQLSDFELSEREKRALLSYESANADRKTAKEAIKQA